MAQLFEFLDIVPSATAIHANRLGPPSAEAYPSIGETYNVFIVRIPFYLTFVWLPANKWIYSRTYPRFCFTSSYDVLRGLLFIMGLMACSHMTNLKSELKQAKLRLAKKNWPSPRHSCECHSARDPGCKEVWNGSSLVLEVRMCAR